VTAAAVTGVLGGRCVRRPRIGLVAWTAATLALTVALAAESIGLARGFGPGTFRVIQLAALGLGPLWLAWGLAETVAGSEAVRFGVRLVSGALTVVASVILTTDPLTARPFSRAWPLTGLHFQPVSRYALDAVQAAAVLAVLASLVMAGARKGLRRRRALIGAASAGLAVLIAAGLRLSLPAAFAYPLLTMTAAVLVLFAETRTRGPGNWHEPGDGYRAEEGSPAVDDYAAAEAYLTDEDYPADDCYLAEDGYPAEDGYLAEDGYPAEDGYLAEDGYPAEDGYLAEDGYPAEKDFVPGAGQVPAAAAAAPSARVGAEFGRPATAPPGGTPARPYGRILIFTLLDDKAADFDRLAEQTAEEVRTREPGTLVYVIHLVPDAPMQRIFYEIYRDRAAFDRHECQPYMRRFVTERGSLVLATNVIELRLKYAKVGPLPNPQPAGASLQPPGAGLQPPGAGLQPPGAGLQPPGAGPQPPRAGLPSPGAAQPGGVPPWDPHGWQAARHGQRREARQWAPPREALSWEEQRRLPSGGRHGHW
jgi:quinol monooxygenase YgiN